MSVNPAKVLGIDKGNLAQGKAADIVIADITEEYENRQQKVCNQKEKIHRLTAKR